MDTLAKRRDHLLKTIAALQQDEWIAALERLLMPLMTAQNKALMYAKPLTPSIQLEQLRQKQHYHPAKSAAAFGALPADEPFADLLNDLKA